MKTISVREMKAHWAAVEKQVREGDTFVVLNRGRPSVRLVPAEPRRVLAWDDHLGNALKTRGKTGEEAVKTDREGRW